MHDALREPTVQFARVAHQCLVVARLATAGRSEDLQPMGRAGEADGADRVDHRETHVGHCMDFSIAGASEAAWPRVDGRSPFRRIGGERTANVP